MEITWKWKIGDTVAHLTSSRARWGMPALPEKMLIMGRLAEECPGGVQLFYLVRMWEPNGLVYTAMVRFHEEELIDFPAEPPPAQSEPPPPGLDLEEQITRLEKRLARLKKEASV